LANATQLSKDDRLRIAEFGLINMDELDAMTPRELNAMKSIITAADVNERAAYGYTKERRVRLASFCASSNRRQFLTDITGNRRWLPFEVESIQSPFHTILPYDYMYAQALYLIEHGFNYWFDLDEINSMEAHNEAFRSQENEEQLLPLLFDIPAEGKGEFMTTAQISEHIVSYGNIKKPISVAQLGMLLGKAGYQPVRRKINATKVRGWLVYQRDSEEITSLKRLLKE
jgi:predicted P-loop ATPase